MPREDNPALLIPVSAFAAGILAGSAATFSGVGGRPLGGGEYIELEDVEGAIILFSSEVPSESLFDRAIGLGVDRATGRSGYSHSALLCGLTDKDGRTLVAESVGMKGTRLHPLDDYGSRKVAVIPLELSETTFARNKALRMVERKTPYRGKRRGITCGEFVATCLPKKLRNEVGLNGFVTPNDIARAFGVVETSPRAPNPTKRLAKKLLR